MIVFRDPVHNLISIDKVEEKLIFDLINSPEVQRLRRIRQLGLSFVTYPGAEHSRFVHSLGVTHLVKRIISQLNQSRDQQERKWLENINNNYILAICAALLHDVGHGPFSHAIEKTTGIKHETWTTLIINSPKTDVHSILESYRHGFANEVAEVIGRIHPCNAVVKLLSSQLDADRIDYLLRDSLMTEAGYGRFDLEWLINVITIGAVGAEPEIGLKLDKGLSIAEDFVMARYYMYKNVYFHKTTRSAELIVSRIFERLKEIINHRKFEYPDQFKAILLGNMECNDDNLSAYLELDDSMVWYWFRIWSKSGDKFLADLCDRIINRRLLKCLNITTNDLTSLFIRLQTLKNRANGLLGESYDSLVDIDDPRTSWYKDNYLFSSGNEGKHDEEASEQIFLFDNHKKPHALADKSDIINGIRNQTLHLQRLYFPEELRTEAIKIFG